MNLKLVLDAILDDYVLPWGGDHGVAHWARVLENGRRLSKLTGADVRVMSLFALLHDPDLLGLGSPRLGASRRDAPSESSLHGGCHAAGDN